MRVAIMQPYFLPYIGYFQLMGAVDRFVVYDNIEYTKKGWVNRNRILVNGADQYITIPLASGPDKADIRDRVLAGSFDAECLKLLRRIKGAYAKAPHFEEVYELFERILRYEDRNLFAFIRNSLAGVAAHLGIGTPVVVSSSISEERGPKGEDRVIALCGALNATAYINPIGGVALYNKERFRQQGIELSFLRPDLVPYEQFRAPFVPGLSILDVIMFNSPDVLRSEIRRYRLE